MGTGKEGGRMDDEYQKGGLGLYSQETLNVEERSREEARTGRRGERGGRRAVEWVRVEPGGVLVAHGM